MTFITAFALAEPPFKLNQSEALNWIARQHATKSPPRMDLDRMRQLVNKFGCKPSQLRTRGSWNPVYADHNTYDVQNFFTDVSLKNKVFQDCALAELSYFYEERSVPKHFIHTTCTGYVSPSAGQVYFAQNKAFHTNIYHAYHMGCYAAVPSLQMAQALCLSRADIEIDLYHSEMCSLQFSPGDIRPEQLVIQSLFADGFCIYRVQQKRPESGFELIHASQEILPQSLDLMTWQTHSQGFYMTLSRLVPSRIRECIADKVQSLLAHFKMNLAHAVTAIHPGGPKIIDDIQRSLNLTEAQIQHSKEVFSSRGNMSSATLPHIWSSIIRDKEIESGTPVLSLAFGPGLTLCMALFKKL